MRTGKNIEGNRPVVENAAPGAAFSRKPHPLPSGCGAKIYFATAHAARTAARSLIFKRQRDEPAQRQAGLLFGDLQSRMLPRSVTS
jgi:hypothetical protein